MLLNFFPQNKYFLALKQWHREFHISPCVGVNLCQKKKNLHLCINIPHTASINTWKAASPPPGHYVICWHSVLELCQRLLTPTAVPDVLLRDHFLLLLWRARRCVWWSTAWDVTSIGGLHQLPSSRLNWCHVTYNSNSSDTTQGCVRDMVAWKKSLICPLKEGALIGEWVWSEEGRGDAENTLFGREGGRKIL